MVASNMIQVIKPPKAGPLLATIKACKRLHNSTSHVPSMLIAGFDSVNFNREQTNRVGINQSTDFIGAYCFRVPEWCVGPSVIVLCDIT
jgi:hypothetical protein